MKASQRKFVESALPDEDAQLEGCKYVVNLLIAGDQGAGKTSLCVRWLYSSFVTDPSQVTRERKEFSSTAKMDDGSSVRVHLHDVSTIAEMGKLRDQAHGVFLLYDTQNGAAFSATEPWLKAKQRMFSTFALVGAKADSPDVKQVRSGKVLALAKTHGLDHFECSAKTGDGVGEAFKSMLECVVMELERLQKHSNI
jgi:GTPase SAR1 family protein